MLGFIALSKFKFNRSKLPKYLFLFVDQETIFDLCISQTISCLFLPSSVLMMKRKSFILMKFNSRQVSLRFRIQCVHCSSGTEMDSRYFYI